MGILKECVNLSKISKWMFFCSTFNSSFPENLAYTGGINKAVCHLAAFGLIWQKGDTIRR